MFLHIRLQYVLGTWLIVVPLFNVTSIGILGNMNSEYCYIFQVAAAGKVVNTISD